MIKNPKSLSEWAHPFDIVGEFALGALSSRIFMSASTFRTETSQAFRGVSATELAGWRAEATNVLGLSSTQTTEAASISLAMVLRTALALTANDAEVCVIADDSPRGWVAIAALRQLVGAGAHGVVLLVPPPGDLSAELTRQLDTVDKMEIPIAHWSSAELEAATQLFTSCHAAIVGVTLDSNAPLAREIAEFLNDQSTPIHTVELPIGVDADTGVGQPYALYASSTLSLGLPLQGLIAASEFAGRHYLCDISLPRKAYEAIGVTTQPLFCEQPVIRIFPPTPAEEPPDIPKDRA